MLLSRACHRHLLAVISSLLSFMIASSVFAGMFPGSEKVRHAGVLERAGRGEVQDLIVVFDESEAKEHAASMRFFYGARHDTPDIVETKARMFRNKKQEALDALTTDDAETIADYDRLPVMFLRVKSQKGLERLAAQSGVVGIYENQKYSLMLNESLPLIGQPTVATALGYTGSGTAVAVLDTGVDYTVASTFGSCTGDNTPGDCLSLPATHGGCSVACVHDFAADDGMLDDFRPYPFPQGHGTNVSGIVAGVAPDAKTIGLDIFVDDSAFTSDIIAAIDWVIDNKSVYNIVAVNMSLGIQAQKMTAPCPTSVFTTPVSNAKAAGILVVIASGNDGFPDGISEPACVPGAVSVGAVYDGGPETPGTPDVVTWFSNSASFLTMLAPGSFITAAGISMQGTSQATPHVAGAIAVLSSAFPAWSVDETLSRLTGNGVPVTDVNEITKPRLDLSFLNLFFSITGKVISQKGVPVEGINVTLSGDASATTVTDADGAYTFSALSNGSYTITPSKGMITFTPSSIAVVVTGSPVTVDDFVADIIPLSGKVRTASGVPVEGVAITMSGSGSAQAITDANGAYVFTDVPSGSYILTPSRGAATFTPAFWSVTVSGADITGRNFTANVYDISGKVLTKSGTPVANVAMALGGAASGVAVTNEKGKYAFRQLANGIYTVTPALTGYSFTSVSKTITVNGSDKTGKNFVAVTHSISGYVRNPSGAPMAGVTMTLSGDAARAKITDSNGFYRFGNLPDGSYVVTPSKTGRTFIPPSLNVNISGANLPKQNFVRSP